MCELPRRLVLRQAEPGKPESCNESLTLDGAAIVVVWQQHGRLLEYFAFGVRIQMHLEDLAAYLAGGERCDPTGMDGLMLACADG